MEQFYQVDPTLDIPIYQQLVDTIRVAVKKGILVSGQQLPTVQEMSQELSIARGTIKRAYDELERAGIVEKGQGRGTFVRYQPADSKSRKEQAMAAIDGMLNQLENMGFSAAEINIFLNLKLRERAEQESNVKVALIECNPENLSQMSEQFRHMKNVDLYSYLLESIQQYPYKLSEDYDLIVTTAAHSEYIESVLPVRKRIARVALRPSPRCLSDIIKLRPGERVGVLGYSDRFAQLLHSTCEAYAEDVILDQPMLLTDDQNPEAYLKGKSAVLLPKAWEKYCATQTAEILRRFTGERIECYYEMDEGSVLYLEAKVKRLLEEKTI